MQIILVCAAADHSENSPPRSVAAMQRPWALDGNSCAGETRILQVRSLSSIAACVCVPLTVARSCPTMR